MTDSANLDDYRWLTGPAAAELLTEVAASDAPLHTWATRLRKSLTASQTHLLLEQVELRNRAQEKFLLADRMFFTRVGLEQATDQWIAAYKAKRFARFNRVADLCCGIGGDLLALANGASTTAIDKDKATLHLAQANAIATLGQERATLGKERAARIDYISRDIAEWHMSECDAWHLDPDRRPAGKRTSKIEFSTPSLETIDSLLREIPHAAIKLAPAADVPTPWQESCELEWITRGGECRQQVAWHGDLANAPGQRTATALHPTPATFTGQPDLPIPVADSLGEYLLEPDPSILAAHLTGAIAAKHGLETITSGIAYLTTDQPTEDPLLSRFRVLDILPLDRRQLTAYFAERQVGILEIKKRGIALHSETLRPETLRKELKLHGNNSATLILAPMAGQHRAIVVERVVLS